jgi:hypothetical protein
MSNSARDRTRSAAIGAALSMLAPRYFGPRLADDCPDVVRDANSLRIIVNNLRDQPSKD